MITLEQLRTEYKPQILALAAQHGLRNVRIFGSVAAGKQTETSDVDILVSRIKGGDPWGVGGFYMDMQELLGQKVDVAIENGLRPSLKEKIMADAVPL